MKKSCWFYFSVLVVSVAIGLILYFGYLLLFPFKTTDFPVGGFPTLKKTYAPGEILTYNVIYNKHTDLPATVIRSFENHVVYQLPTTETNNKSGRQDFINTSVIIPDCLPPGEYVMRMTIIYHVNPFRDISHIIETSKFTVIGDCP